MRRLIPIARILWVMVAVLSLAITTVSAPLLFEHYTTLCTKPASACLNGSQLSPEGLRIMDAVGISLGF